MRLKIAAVVPLDPIVSLSVALAEAPGTCAFLLGSGVSRDAGVPTGAEVMRAGLHRLHQLETSSSEQIDDEALDAWLEETDRGQLSYSTLLEAITPDAAVRREYLAGFFEGIEPGATHEALADLAAQGMTRVFVTTNFDRLLERSLHARGIEPVVLASDADLEAGIPREHAQCVVIKPHGDYLRQTIRNTTAELAELDPGLTAELREVVDRYGVVVLGYSGSDEGLGRILRKRRSRYGLWWVSRGELGQPAAELVEATAGRVIVRDSAAGFLRDLQGRLAVFAAHPTGHTPAEVHDETLALVAAGRRVELDEHLRRETNWWEAELAEITATAAKSHPGNEEEVRGVWKSVLPIVERRVASLLPLAIHGVDAFGAQLAVLARGLETRPSIAGYASWVELPEFAVTWIGYVIGGLLTRLDRYEQMGPLLEQTWSSSYDTEHIVWLPGDLPRILGNAVIQGGNWLSPGWELLTHSLEELEWLEERYPELYGHEEARESMGQFDFLFCLYLGLAGHRSHGFYTLGRGGAEELALRLHGNDRLRERVAHAFGLTLEDFDARAPNALDDTSGFQGGASSDPGYVARLLHEGRAASY